MPESGAHPLRILLVDDHALFREGVARLLAAEPDFQVIALCGTATDALDFLQGHAVDLVLLDFDLGDHDCSGFAGAAADNGFQGKILLVTAGVREDQAADLIRRGVSGIFMKHNPPGLLLQAIRDVMSGKVWLTQQFLQSTMKAAALSPGATTDVARFTERERQVLGCVFEGLANKEIAECLSVSESSVKATLQQLFSKTGVRTRSQLVRVTLERYRDLL